MDDYRIIIDPQEEDEFNIAGVYVKVLQIEEDKADSENTKYVTKLEEFVTPFSIKNNEQTDSTINLTEVVGNLKLNQIDYDIVEDSNGSQPPKIAQQKEVETTVSRGYSINIPTIGHILITHNGDVILKILNSSGGSASKKTLHIETPKQIILNLTNAPYLNLDVVASTICISRGDKASLNSLNFRPFAGSDVTKGLFIDVNCLLCVSSLKLKKSLLFVMGQLSVIDECIVDGGYIFNSGEIKLSCRKSELSCISYFFNGSEAKFSSFFASIETNGFSNLGKIESNSLFVVVNKAFDNQGSIVTNNNLTVQGEAEILNSGLIKNPEGTVSIENQSFLHKSGEINAKTIILLSNANQIEGQIIGEEATFYNTTVIKNCEENSGLKQPLVNLRKAVISGTFLNECFFKPGEVLQLIGEHTELHNHSFISTQHIISDANEAIIKSGKIEAVKITVNNGLLATKSCFENLESVEVNNGGELFFPKEENKISTLKEIKNKGKLKIQTSIPLLKSIENEIGAQLHIEANCDFNNITSFNNISGETVFESGVVFRNVKTLVLPPESKMTFCKGSRITGADIIVVGRNSSLDFDEGTITTLNLQYIFNYGFIVFPCSVHKLLSLYNGPDAELVFLDQVTVKGSDLTDYVSASKSEGMAKIISKYNSMIPESSTEKATFGVFNEGNILIKSKLVEKTRPISMLGDIKSFFQTVPNDKNENDEPTFYVRKGLRIYSNYVASENAKLKLEDYTIISAFDFVNYGMIISPEKMRIDEISTISRIGTVLSNEGIDMNICVDQFVFDKTFTPLIGEQNMQFNINSNGAIECFDDHNFNAHLNVVSKKFFCKGNLTANSLDLKTNEFYIEKDEEDKNEVSFKEKFSIITNFFMNHGGVLRQQDEDNESKIIVSDLFQNTGAGNFSADHRTAQYYDQNNKLTNVPRLDKAGLISTGGKLEIKVGTFDNCFGIINGISGLKIESSNIINNECGLILSSGKTDIKGIDLDNGHYQISQEFKALSVFKIRSTSLPNYFIMRPRNGYTNSTNTNTALSVNNNRYYSPPSLFPGYIFSHDDLNIDMKKPCYIGTLVSEKDIYFKGQRIMFRSSNEFGTLIAGGNITAEFQNARLEQFNIQARNIVLKMFENLMLNGIIRSYTRKGNQVDIVDLTKFGQYLGYLTDQETFRNQGDYRTGPTSIISLMSNPSKESFYSITPTKDAAFLKSRPKSEIFIKSIDDSILNQLVRLTLTPLGGRDILLRVDLINELNKAGLKLLGSFSNSRNIVLKNGDPAIVYEEMKDQEVEMEIEGEKVLVPICNPYLILSTVTKMITKLQAEESATLHTKGNIEMRPGKVIDVKSPDVRFEAEGQVTIQSEYRYTGRRKTGVNVANLNFPGSLTLSGDSGVTTKGVNISANHLSIKSKNGSIIDYGMKLDPVYNYTVHSKRSSTTTIHQDVHTSTLSGNSIELSAPKGSIHQKGTLTKAGSGGVNIEARNYKYEPMYTYDYYYHTEKKKRSSMTTYQPKAGGIISSGDINFCTRDATLIGATIVASTLKSETNGNIHFLPAYIDQRIYHQEKKSRFLGSTTVTYNQERHIPVGCTILAQNLKMLGSGELEMVGVTGKIVNATILKNINERAAYEESKTVITQRSSGFCPPKINGDCFVNAIKNMSHSMTCFVDTFSSTLGLVGSACKTMNDIKILTNLSTIPNPTLAIANILIGRFVSSFSFVNTKTVTIIEEKKPVQSKLDIEVLRVSNDRTHLEGVWNIKGKASIETGEFTTKAPEYNLHTHSKTTGYSISLSPTALFSACIKSTVLSIGACLPSISVFSMEKDVKQKDNVAQVLTADDLFIRCDNAVFSGSKIKARLIECIVSGDLKIEDIEKEFVSVEKNSSFSVNLGGIYSLVKTIQTHVGLHNAAKNIADKTSNKSNPKYDDLLLRNNTKKAAFESGFIKDVLTDTKFLHPALNAIPQIRIAEEKTMEKSVQNLASLVGKEKFYLHVTNLLHTKNALVGIVEPDGVVANSENEKIEAGRVLEEKCQQTYHHEKTVFNPCISEFVSTMASFQSWQKTVEDIELRNYEKALKENKTVHQAKLDAKLKTKAMLDIIDKAAIDQLVGLLIFFKMYDSSLGPSQAQNQSNDEKKDMTAEKQKEKSPQKGINKQQEKSPRREVNKQQEKSPQKEENQQQEKSSQKEESLQDRQSSNDQNNVSVNLPNDQADINIDEQRNKASDALNIDDIDINTVDESTLTADQILMLKTKLVLNNISNQQLATLIAYTKQILDEPKGVDCPFMNETTLEQAVFRLKAEGLFDKREVRWSDTKWKDYGLYLIFHSIRATGEVMVQNQELIDSSCKIIGWITDVLKMLNPGVGLAKMVTDKIQSHVQGVVTKQLMEQFGFILSDKYYEYVYKFAAKATNDDRIVDEIIQACRLIPIIIKNSFKIVSAITGLNTQATAVAINNRDVFPMKSVKDVSKLRIYHSPDYIREAHVKNVAKQDKELMEQSKYLLNRSSNDTPKNDSTSSNKSTSFNFTQEMPETKFSASDFNTKYSFSFNAPKPSTSAPKPSTTNQQSSTTTSSLKVPRDFVESGFVKGYKAHDPHHFDLPIKKTVPPYSYFRKKAAEEAKNPQPSLDIPSEFNINNSPLKGANNKLLNSSDVQSPLPTYQSKTELYYEAWKAGLSKK